MRKDATDNKTQERIDQLLRLIIYLYHKINNLEEEVKDLRRKVIYEGD